MLKNKSRLIYSIGCFILIALISITFVLMCGNFKDKVHADEQYYKLNISKTSTVTVYVSGPGVILDSSSSTDRIDAYLVEKSTSVTLRAVNETRIFRIYWKSNGKGWYDPRWLEW